MSLRLRRWSRLALTALAIGYPIALLLVAVLLRFLGEHWWVTGIGLYVPRIGFAIPLPFLAISIALARAPRLWWSQLAALPILVFPLLGLNVARPRSAGTPHDRPTLRVLSYNVNSGYGDYGAVAQEISKFAPDLVLVQEIFGSSAPLEAVLSGHFPHIQSSTQFLIASRFPILASVDPERIQFFGARRSPRFMKYVVATPLGELAIFSVHTISPRSGIYALRGHGLRRELLSGRFFAGSEARQLQETASLRQLQIEALVRMAEKEPGAVLIAGDLNLPTLSPVFARFLGRYRDGFNEVSTGLGYTYPSKYPWMRLDRILSNDRLRFLDFKVGRAHVSDHLCVMAELALEPG